jgi:hypothetical protein
VAAAVDIYIDILLLVVDLFDVEEEEVFDICESTAIQWGH